MKSIEFFAGIGGIKSSFHDSYSEIIEEENLNNIVEECFETIPVYDLKHKFQASPTEYFFCKTPC